MSDQTEYTDVDIEPAKQWAKSFLQERGCQLQSQFVPVRLNPWSQVYQIKTSVGTIYLKQMAPPFAIEARLLLLLGCSYTNQIPEVVGHNDDLSCFLMFDSGMPLRDRLKSNYPLHFAKKALNTYAILQQDASSQIDTLLSLGTPDWRLTNLPMLYEELLNEQSFLKADGVTDPLLKRLHKQRSNVTKLCKQLMQYDIVETIEHGDFHDNNCLIDAQDALVINNWGDAVITHPFFSLISFLKSAERHHNISVNTALYQDLRDTYLTTWQAFEPESRLLEAFELAKKLAPIKFSLSFYRVSQCPGIDGLGEYKGAITEALQQFLFNGREP